MKNQAGYTWLIRSILIVGTLINLPACNTKKASTPPAPIPSGDATASKIIKVQAGVAIKTRGPVVLVADSENANSWLWEKLSGPGELAFSDSKQLNPTVTASVDGIYKLKLTASAPGSASASNEYTLVWDTTAPVITLTPNLRAFEKFELNASAGDAVTFSWEKVSGPGNVTFSSQTASPQFNADIDGTYVIRLTAKDELGNAASAESSIVWLQNSPMVNAGPDVYTNSKVSIKANAIGAVKYEWSKVSGDGDISFGTSNSAETTVSASKEGAYVLRVIATNDVGFALSDELTFTWDKTPPSFGLIPDQVVTTDDDNPPFFIPVMGGDRYFWSQASGPGVVTFSQANSMQTSGKISATGNYSLRFRAEDLAGNASEITLKLKYNKKLLAKQISVSSTHTCALTMEGSVKCWGNGQNGALGNADYDTLLNPIDTSIEFGGGKTALQISAGYDYTCALLNDFSAKCWGLGNSGQLGQANSSNAFSPPSNSIKFGTGMEVSQIIASQYHSCAIRKSDGGLVCWGSNSYGALGYESAASSANPPFTETVKLLDGHSAVQVATGIYHTCALLEDSTVKCWGYNAYGQLGNGTFTNANIPESAPVLLGLKATQIAVGDLHSCALLEDGSVKCWGYGYYGALGNGSDQNISTPDLSGIILGAKAKAIALGYRHTCALLEGGTVKCWGYNGSGQLGNGGNVSINAPSNKGINLGLPALSIAAKDHSTCAILSDHSVKCWGSGYNGNLGYGTTSDLTAPPAESIHIAGKEP